VRKRALHFVPAGAVNDMDNERADVNGDGVQLHLATRRTPETAAEPAAWLLVPQGEQVRVVPLDERAGAAALRACWTPTPDGYRLRAAVPLASLAAPAGVPPGLLGVGLLVNDGAPGRERRRGQLVLGGARGEFVYLRGDRHDPARLLWFRLPHA